ncbi:MFS transporter [Streptomyces sp. WZ-12]|uniref:MFS transporter n=1 Tax=Streptomyces sp. WZ-12 TaxID=3030210 RepID=UPI002381750E|nr:MFS transporter [Streptomyces sp. WZ-12]
MSGDSARSTGGGVGGRSRQLAVAVYGSVVLVFATINAVNLALPSLSASALHPSPTAMLWIVDAYAIVFACLLIPAGVVGDRFGRKRTLISGLVVFAIGALASALAPGTSVLLGARALTGAGAAFVLPTTLALLLAVIPQEGRAKAVATWTAMASVGGVAGNLGSGIVLQFLPWPALFGLLAVVACGLAVLAARGAPRTPGRPMVLDPVGALLLALTLLGLLYAIIEGPERGWTSAPVLSSAVAAVVLLVGFAGWELRHREPMLDPRVFALRELRAGTLGVTVVFVAVFALFYTNAQYLQYAKGFSALLTGVAVLPYAIGTFVASRNSVRLTERLGRRVVVSAGLVLTVLALVLLSTASAGTPYWLYACYLLVFAAGAGVAVPPMSTGILSSLPPHRAGLGSGLNSATRELGSALGVAVLGTVMNVRFASRLPKSVEGGEGAGHGHGSVGAALNAASRLSATEHGRVIDAFTQAMGDGYRAVGVVVLAGAVLVMVWFRPRRGGATGAAT